MKKLSLVIITVLFLFNVEAQTNYLIITNRSTSKENKIKENRKIKILTDQGRTVKGRFIINNDSSLVIGSELVKLSEIATIKLKPAPAQILGILFSGAAAGSLIAGTSMLSQKSEDDWGTFFVNLGGMFMFGCGVVLAIPASLLLVMTKNYAVENWNYKNEISSMMVK